MATARLYRPSKTAMQSGKAKTKAWILEYNPTTPLFTNPVTGWTGSSDTPQQLRLSFQTLDAALDYVQKNQIDVTVSPSHDCKTTPKSYSDNFRYDKVS